jgi:hypothetical protein
MSAVLSPRNKEENRDASISEGIMGHNVVTVLAP